MSIVMVTGCRGFTGIHLTNALREKAYTVHGLVREKKMSDWEHQANLLNKTQLIEVIQKIQPEYIFHLAGVSFVAHQCHADFYETNVIGTLNLLEALESAKIQPKKIIIASSANVYGNPNQSLIDEDTPAYPLNHYACSKLAMENMVRLWFDRFPILITRPFNYTGKGQSENFLIPKIVSYFRANQKIIPLGNIDVYRDMSDIDYVVNAYVKLLSHPSHSEIINICSGIAYSIADILEIMSHIAGYQIQVEVDKKLIRDNEIKKLVGSNQKLQKIIGHLEIPQLSDTLARMYEN